MLDFLNKTYIYFNSSSINFFTILTLIIIYSIIIFSCGKIIKRLEIKVNDGKKKIILQSLKKPLNFFFLSCFTAIITIFFQKYSDHSLIIAHKIFKIGLVFAIIWFGWRMVLGYENYFTEDKKQEYDLTTIDRKSVV